MGQALACMTPAAGKGHCSLQSSIDTVRFEVVSGYMR